MAFRSGIRNGKKRKTGRNTNGMRVFYHEVKMKRSAEREHLTSGRTWRNPSEPEPDAGRRKGGSMAKLLHIEASPRKERSSSIEVAKAEAAERARSVAGAF